MQECAEPKMKNCRRKVFLLDIDAVNLNYIENNIGLLPNLRSLFAEGRLIKANSSADLLSASPWQTFASGLMPGEHGHYFPLQWNPASMRFMPMRGNTLFFEPFWSGLARRGIKTVVFDAMAVPLDVNSAAIQVINWNTQCNFPVASNRKDVLAYIKRNFGRKPIGDEIVVKKSRKVLSRLRDQQVTSVRKKTDAILWMMKEFDWQFFLTAYYEAHRAGHNLWPLWEDFSSDPPENAMLEVFQELDTQLGRLLAALDLTDTVLVLFSMHGMQPGAAQDHFLRPVLNRVNLHYANAVGDHRGNSERRSIAQVLRKSVPGNLQLSIRELVGQRIQDWLIDREFRGAIDWKNTPAFAVPGSGDVGFIRLNILGREREGCLDPKEGRQRYIDFLCGHLRDLRVTQTEEPLVRDIVLAEKAFPGSRSDFLPDILVTWAPNRPATEVHSEVLGSVTAQAMTGRGGTHTGESFAVICGAAQTGHLPPLGHIVDYRRFIEGLLGSVPA